MKKAFIFLLVLLFLCAPAFGANIEVSPVKVFMDAKNRIEKLTIKNQGESEINLRVKVFRWRQGETGQDIYDEDTGDLIVVPKILRLKKGEEKIIRIGINNLPAMEKEASYRIYIEEIPQPESEKKGATLRLYMKIGIPVFIGPEKRAPNIEIEAPPTIENKELRLKVINKGNAHNIISRVLFTGKDFQGKEVFSRSVSGWYLLAGAKRVYTVDALPNQIHKLVVTVFLPPEESIVREFSQQQILVQGVKND